MRTLASLIAVGAGGVAYASSMDQKSKKRWRKKLSSINSFIMKDLIPKDQMKRMRRQLSKAL
ncbi:hypothetical protein ACM26V_23825 [Salipaludibacillus sp. HK11]|uniref:hypothetical protein n=1 Tax=Salipaludibacillus sp. HK11 TaxID=3394320 RepID=UPI0039FDBCDE